MLRDLLPASARARTDFVVVNGENAAGGIGITLKEADELLRSDVDAITLGNHTYRHREIWPYLAQERRIIRPYNYLPTQPGRGRRSSRRAEDARRCEPLRQRAPAGWLTAARRHRRGAQGGRALRPDPRRHARGGHEREGRAGWYLDGKVTAVVGTHATSRPPTTASSRRTAYITDVGMTGGAAVDGDEEGAVNAVMRTHMPMRYEPSEVDPWLMGVFIESAGPRKAA